MAYSLKSIRNEFKEKGIFYTPPELAEMMKEYINFEPRNVYDPTCGDGGLLAVFDDSIPKFGQEINESQLEVAKNNLTNFTGVCADTLKEPHFMDKKFHVIIANPPFSIKWEPKQDERFSAAPTIPTKGKADYAFLLHILYLLDDDGTAVTMNFPGILYRGQREGKIRKWMVEQGYINRVVNIQGGYFEDTAIDTCLVIISKQKSTEIIFEDKALGKEVKVDIDKIRKNDFSLSVNNYVYEEETKEEIDPSVLMINARKQTMESLKKDINFDKQVCEIEGWDHEEFLSMLKKVINNSN